MLSIAKVFVWTIWKWLAIGAWISLEFIGRFVRQLVRLIHSKKRVLCAVDGTLGGIVSYVWLSGFAGMAAERVLVVVFGGIIGAALGILNWELVSKRVYRIGVPTDGS